MASSTAPHGSYPASSAVTPVTPLVTPGTGDILVENWKQVGLRRPSVVRSRRLWTAEERDFDGTTLGTVDPSVLDQVRQHVQGLLDT